MGYTEINWSLQSPYPILAALQLVPLGFMLMLLLDNRPKITQAVSVVGAIASFGLAVELYRRFDLQQSAMQFAESAQLWGPLNYHVAVDGMSVLFLLLGTLLVLLILVYGLTLRIPFHQRELAAIFAVEACFAVQFTNVDMMWFFTASLLQLGLVAYLLSQRSTSPETDLALSRFNQFMGTGLLLLFMGIMVLGWNYAHTQGHWSFDLYDLALTPVPLTITSIAFFLLFYGLGVRIPLFPLHGWLPLVAEHGTVAVAGVLLLGIKVGVFGLLRFVFPLMPDTVAHWHVYVVAFATAGIFYAALLALLQKNLRRLLAFAVVSHTSILVIGLFSLEHDAFQGSILLAVNFGLATAGLLFTTGMVYRRTRTMVLNRLGGLFDAIPLIGITFLAAGLSIVGMPGTPGFDAAHLVLEAAIDRFGALPTVAAALGNVIAAGFLLFAFQKAFLASSLDDGTTRDVERTTTPERFIAGLLILVLFWTGFHSEPWLELIDSSLKPLSVLYEHH